MPQWGRLLLRQCQCVDGAPPLGWVPSGLPVSLFQISLSVLSMSSSLSYSRLANLLLTDPLGISSINTSGCRVNLASGLLVLPIQVVRLINQRLARFNQASPRPPGCLVGIPDTAFLRPSSLSFPWSWHTIIHFLVTAPPPPGPPQYPPAWSPWSLRQPPPCPGPHPIIP